MLFSRVFFGLPRTLKREQDCTLLDRTMVKRGLSVEEKRDKVLHIYHSTKAIYSLKEIEKAASKQGVTINTVKVRVSKQRRRSIGNSPDDDDLDIEALRQIVAAHGISRTSQ